MSLSYKQVAMIDDGYRAVAILTRGKDDLKEPGKCRDFLVGRKIAREKWGLAPDKPLTKGKLAYMVCQALGIKGGVTMRLFGPSQRYCLFECQYLELMTGGATYEHVTGGELVSTIDRADQYKQTEETEAAAKAAKKTAALAEGQQKAADDEGNKETSSNVKKAEATEGKATATDTRKSSEKAKETAAKGTGSPKAENTSDDASESKPEKGQASPPAKPVQ